MLAQMELICIISPRWHTRWVLGLEHRMQVMKGCCRAGCHFCAVVGEGEICYYVCIRKDNSVFKLIYLQKTYTALDISIRSKGGLLLLSPFSVAATSRAVHSWKDKPGGVIMLALGSTEWFEFCILFSNIILPSNLLLCMMLDKDDKI